MAFALSGLAISNWSNFLSKINRARKIKYPKLQVVENFKLSSYLDLSR
jgi:hypothetical protein